MKMKTAELLGIQKYHARLAQQLDQVMFGKNSGFHGQLRAIIAELKHSLPKPKQRFQ